MRQVRLHVPAVDEVGVRVAVSPMHTAAASLFEILGGQRRGVGDAWVRTALRRARTVDVAPLGIFALPERRVPDFVVPVPNRARSTFPEQLARLAATPPDTVRAQIAEEFGARAPRPFAAWIAEPETALARYTASLRAWWDAVLAPEWERMEALLEAEVLRVAHLLATQGPEGMLSQLHGRLRCEDGVLVWPDPRRRDIAIAGRRLLLIPLACGPDGFLAGPDLPGVVEIAYAAPGTAAVVREAAAGAPEDLVSLLGPARARLLVRLELPLATGSLARELSLSPSTVSAHLAALTAMGLAAGTRRGRYVLYQRTPRARRLLELYPG